MTEINQTLLTQFQTRKTKKQKAAFFQWVAQIAQEHGYSVKKERGSLVAKNIVVGDPDTAKVVYTAHYDTCSLLPFPNFATPKNIPLFVVYQVILSTVLLFIAAMVAAAWIIWELPLSEYSFAFANFGLLVFLLFGPASKHTANDNTSGVATILQIMTELPEELRGETAFVLFDLEEAGLLGSAGFYRKHKKAMKHKVLINFDCVSDGNHLLFCIPKKAKHWIPQLKNAFAPSEKKTVEFCTKGFFFPSDQAKFPCGIGVVALNKGPLGVLYMDRIHTKHDTVFQEDRHHRVGKNIRLLTQGTLQFVEKLYYAKKFNNGLIQA